MSQINFPTATSNGQTFEASTGVIYRYIGTPPNGHWSGTFADGGSTSLNNTYVNLDDSGAQQTIKSGGLIITDSTSNNNITFSPNGTGTFLNTISATALIPTASSAPANGMYLPAANSVGISTNSNVRVTIDSTGKVGIGNTSPTKALTIGGSGADIAFTDGGEQAIIFGDSADTDIGYIYYNHDAEQMGFGVNATAALTINSSADATFANRAAFAGFSLSAASSSTGVGIYDGYLAVTNTTGTDSLFEGYQTGTGDPTVKFTANGTGTFAGEVSAASLDISGDVDIDGTLEADAYTVNGTALDTHIAGVTVTNATNATTATNATNSTNATNATNASNITVADESSDTDCYPVFVTADTGTLAPKTGSNLSFNSSSGNLSASSFSGTGNIEMTSSTNAYVPLMKLANSGTGGYGGKIAFFANSTNHQEVTSIKCYSNNTSAAAGAGTGTIAITAAATTCSGTLSCTSLSETSDQKFKQNITAARSQLADVKALGGILKNFDWTNDAPVDNKSIRFLGLIAQEVEPISPQVVVNTVRKNEETNELEEYKSIKIDILIYKLLGAVAELEQRLSDAGI